MKLELVAFSFVCILSGLLIVGGYLLWDKTYNEAYTQGKIDGRLSSRTVTMVDLCPPVPNRWVCPVEKKK